MSHQYFTFPSGPVKKWDLNSIENLILNGLVNNNILQFYNDPATPNVGLAKVDTDLTTVKFIHSDFTLLDVGDKNGKVKWDFVESKRDLDNAIKTADNASTVFSKAQLDFNASVADKTVAQIRFDKAEINLNA